MTTFRNSLSKKLTAMNMLVSGGVLLLASVAFFGSDLVTFRANLITNTSIQAQIIGSNAVSPLLFNDAKSAESTLSALRASQHITYAGIYSARGDFVAGYWRDHPSGPAALPSVDAVTRETVSFSNREFTLARAVEFQGKDVGYVFIRSDLGAITDRLRSYVIIFCTILTLSLAAALTLSRISQRSISRPILALADTAKVVSQQKDYSIRMPVPTDHDEVAVLVDEFNQMLTEIQNRDSALQNSEEQFRTLANSISQLAWMGDSEGNLTWYNQRWYEYTGTTLEQMAGWGWQTVHDPQKLIEVLPKWRAALAKGEVFEIIIPLRGADGNFRQFLTRAVPIRDAQGKVARWFGTNTDITEQLRSEENLRQTEKLAATGRLAASIAHEINNPLEAVTNLIYLARRQPANTEKYLRLADEELDRIAQITKNTLGFYRDSASPTTVNISEALREVLSLYSRKMEFKRVVLISDPGDAIQITGYPGEVRQVFANLIANAIDALPREGILRVRATRGFCRNGITQRGVRVTFLDNGSGISPADLKKIFAPFYTTKKDTGTGLGLWLVKGLVEKHRGTLDVRSGTEPGKSWTAFSVFLPDHALPT